MHFHFERHTGYCNTFFRVIFFAGNIQTSLMSKNTFLGIDSLVTHFGHQLSSTYHFYYYN